MNWIKLAFIIGFIWPLEALYANDSIGLDISVTGVYPNEGATLETEEPIYLRLNYQNANPNEEFYVWAKVLDETYQSTYQGSVDKILPGDGVVERFVYLTEPGWVKKIHIVVKTLDFKEVFNEFINVDYQYVASEKYTTLKDDGLGSDLSSLDFSAAIGSTLKVGEKVIASLKYDVNTDQGLDIWVVPETECSNSYEGTRQKLTGKGDIQKFFVIGEPCELKQIKLLMRNVVSATVFEKIIDVDFTYK